MKQTSKRTDNRKPPSPRFKWADQHRQALFIIYDEFKFNNRQAATIFNKVFAEELSRQEIVEGLLPHVVAVQYHQKFREDRPSSAWKNTSLSPVTEKEKKYWDALRRSIKADAQALGLIPRADAESSQKAARHESSKSKLDEGVHAFRSTQGRWIREGFETYIFKPSTPRKRPFVGGQDDDSDCSPDITKPRGIVKTNRSSALEDFKALTRAEGNSARALKGVTAKRSQRSPRQSSNRTSRATVPYARPWGDQKAIMITPEELDRANPSLVAVKAEQAHPDHPRILYRWWCESSAGMNSASGFKAQKLVKSDLTSGLPPPSCEHLDWDDLKQHLNRDKFPSPFISTSSSFIWTWRLALKEAASGVGNAHISVIDRHILGSKATYYVPPYHKELRRKLAFDNGAQHYHGSSEFLVWKRIPGNAIIRTFKVNDLIRLREHNPALSNIMPTSIIAKRGGFQTKILQLLRQARNRLTAEVAISLARLVHFMGVTASKEKISNIISDTVQGLGILVEHQSPDEWANLACTFAREFCNLGNLHSTYIRDFYISKMGFLWGVCWGTGMMNCQLKGLKDLRAVQRRASGIGLDSPAAIIIKSLESISHELRIYEEKQRVFLTGGTLASRKLPSPRGPVSPISLRDEDLIEISDHDDEDISVEVEEEEEGDDAKYNDPEEWIA